jgi:hypothetical protein
MNWRAYDASLCQRDSLTVWFTDEAIEGWRAQPRTIPGGQPWCSLLATLTELALRGKRSGAATFPKLGWLCCTWVMDDVRQSAEEVAHVQQTARRIAAVLLLGPALDTSYQDYV